MIVRFAGDSGDGMQLAGSRFTDATAALGNDLATLPNFPAEIRAPAGTLAGVSAFQIHFAVAGHPHAGRRAERARRDEPGGAQGERRRAPARRDDHRQRGRVHASATSRRPGYESNPLEDGSLNAFRVHRVPMNTLTPARRRGDGGASRRATRGRAKNLFALGLLSWLYGRPTEVTERWIEQKFAPQARPSLEANLAAFNAGWSFGETTELLDVQYRVAAGDDVPPGTYRNVNGTTALSLGLIAASVRSGLPLVLASYPITPASELLHELSRTRSARRAHDPGRGRDRRRRDGARRRVRRAARRDRDERPGHGSEGRDDRARGDARAADGRHRRPARRAVDRHADQDRAVGSADGALRPPRRVAAAGDRADARPASASTAAFEAVPIAIRYRTPVILLSDSSWPPPRSRGGSRTSSDAAADRPGLRHRAADGEVFVPYSRDERLRAAVGDSRDARAAAPDRRHREGGRHRQHLLRRRPTTS